MKIGVYFTSNKTEGGAYQYAISFLESLSKIKGHKYVVISVSNDVPVEFLHNPNFKFVFATSGIRLVIFKISNLASLSLEIILKYIHLNIDNPKVNKFLVSFYKLIQFGMVALLMRDKPDIFFFPTPSDLSYLLDIPTISTVYDLEHRRNPQFKEVSEGARWLIREFNYRNISETAKIIFVDSTVGKEDMEYFYPASRGKVVVLPYLSPSYIDPNISVSLIKMVKNKYFLPDNFIFYPAKFWPHKNHKNLILALFYLKSHGKKINIVFTGSKDADFSSFEEVMKLVKKEKLESQVFYPGLVSNQELSAIYKLAKVMVMPTFLGPTNIPVLEAWTMGVPVIYSDIRGCREQLEDAGLLINPKSPRDIADKILKIYTQPRLVSELVSKGYKKVHGWSLDDFSEKVAGVIEGFEKEKNAISKNNKKWK